MTISEIGLLKLKPPHSLTDPDLRSRLQSITAGLSKFTGHPFRFCQQVEDPAYIYLVGEWNSLTEHYGSMHSSDEFKKLLPVMKQFFEFQWMAHYDFELRETTLEEGGYLEVGCFVLEKGDDDKEAFQECVDVVWESIGKDAMGGSEKKGAKPLGGWKVDEKREDEEYVFLLPFADKAAQQAFYETEAGEAYEALKSLTQDAEIRHMKLLKDL